MKNSVTIEQKSVKSNTNSLGYKIYTDKEKEIMLSGVSNARLAKLLGRTTVAISVGKVAYSKEYTKKTGKEAPYKSERLTEEQQEQIVQDYIKAVGESNIASSSPVSTPKKLKRKLASQSKVVQAIAKMQKGTYEKIPVKPETIRIPLKNKFNKLVVDGVSVEIDQNAKSIRVTQDAIEINF